jgi:hypothetical protein
VQCSATNPWVITWCGYTNDGQNYLNIGVNWQNPGGNSYYERMNLYSDGNGCISWGSNKDEGSGGWANYVYQCEERV